ncbi:MAG: 23S rRNA (guanosine(2251)-2'-O)-methyltransferase RlmB [Gammaproteobacteria bacterium]|nr:MAG: 23S rRNA (guanosine(2251)-2'-O)-methyltransferase RlmB [Gammaproteobacteria bacterium]
MVYGPHAVSQFVESAPDRVIRLLLAQRASHGRLQALAERVAAAGIPMTIATREEMEACSGGGVHQGVIAIVHPKPPGDENNLEHLLVSLEVSPFLLILDGIQDPHNLGACLRTADATGVHAVIAPKNRAVGLTPAVRKVATGAAETVPFIQVTNLARTLRFLAAQGICCIGTDGQARETLFDTDLRGPLALVMGAEGRGLRRLTREHCDRLVSLPLLGSVESLNVSVATGACLYFALSQRAPKAESRLA